MVVWKEIPNFGLYECSDAGQIRNKRTGKILKPQNEKYKKLTLYNGTKNTCKYQKLVAKEIKKARIMALLPYCATLY